MADTNKLDLICSQNCIHAGDKIESQKHYHSCNKSDIKISSLERRSGCKYCPHFSANRGKKIIAIINPEEVDENLYKEMAIED